MKLSLVCRFLLAAAVAACTAGLAPGAAQAQGKECALVLMHGKWSSPQYLGVLARRLEAACAVKLVEMPWSQRRAYDQPYPVALADVAAQVKAYREQGYRRVLVGGHSFGANAGLAYMAWVGDADGVVALAPGHNPAGMYRGGSKDAVDKARELAAAGKGGETLSIADTNQGAQRGMRMSAETLLSYFDPQGLGDMPTSAAGFRKPVPVFWAIGAAEPFAGRRELIFDKLPANAYSQFLVVQGDHGSAVDAAVPELLAWLKALP